MSIVNAALARVTDILLLPFSGWHPLAGLSVVSLATAVVMLVIFRRTSNQQKLAAVKRSIHAGVFEIRLYNDDFFAILRAQPSSEAWQSVVQVPRRSSTRKMGSG
jgi:hypothetical protein